MKKLFCVLMCIMMVVVFMPTVAFAGVYVEATIEDFVLLSGTEANKYMSRTDMGTKDDYIVCCKLSKPLGDNEMLKLTVSGKDYILDAVEKGDSKKTSTKYGVNVNNTSEYIKIAIQEGEYTLSVVKYEKPIELKYPAGYEKGTPNEDYGKCWATVSGTNAKIVASDSNTLTVKLVNGEYTAYPQIESVELFNGDDATNVLGIANCGTAQDYIMGITLDRPLGDGNYLIALYTPGYDNDEEHSYILDAVKKGDSAHTYTKLALNVNNTSEYIKQAIQEGNYSVKVIKYDQPIKLEYDSYPDYMASYNQCWAEIPTGGTEVSSKTLEVKNIHGAFAASGTDVEIKDFKYGYNETYNCNCFEFQTTIPFDCDNYAAVLTYPNGTSYNLLNPYIFSEDKKAYAAKRDTGWFVWAAPNDVSEALLPNVLKSGDYTLSIYKFTESHSASSSNLYTDYVKEFNNHYATYTSAEGFEKMTSTETIAVDTFPKNKEDGDYVKTVGYSVKAVDELKGLFGESFLTNNLIKNGEGYMYLTMHHGTDANNEYSVQMKAPNGKVYTLTDDGYTKAIWALPCLDSEIEVDATYTNGVYEFRTYVNSDQFSDAQLVTRQGGWYATSSSLKLFDTYSYVVNKYTDKNGNVKYATTAPANNVSYKWQADGSYAFKEVYYSNGGWSGPSVVVPTTQEEQKEAEEKLEEKKEDTQVALDSAIKAMTFKAKSTKQTKLNGKTAIKVSWNKVEGADGYAVFRSTKKYSGYGKTAYFRTTKTTYTNNKDLVKGKTYYYKVKPYKVVDGKRVYSTLFSTKAWRTVK